MNGRKPFEFSVPAAMVCLDAAAVGGFGLLYLPLSFSGLGGRPHRWNMDGGVVGCGNR
ncbi:MAG: hypothetical protein ACR2HY_10850 [Acidimicrobiales bacterium]